MGDARGSNDLTRSLAATQYGQIWRDLRRPTTVGDFT